MEGYAESATDIEGLIQKTEVVGSVSTSPDHSLRLAAQCMHPICLRAHIGGAVLQGEHFQGETWRAPLNWKKESLSYHFGLLPVVKSESESRSVMSDPLQLHGPWNSLGQTTGVGSLSLL